LTVEASPARLVVLVSGNGSNLQAVLDACRNRSLPAEVVAVFSNRKEAYGLERARAAGVPAVWQPKPKDQDRRQYDATLADAVIHYRPDWILLLGWMRLLSSPFLEHFPGRVINLHPALPQTFPGINAIQRAFDAYQLGHIQHTGVMVHLVPDEGVDCGPLLGQQEVPIYPQDDLHILEDRIHQVEHHLLVTVLAGVLASAPTSY